MTHLLGPGIVTINVKPFTNNIKIQTLAFDQYLTMLPVLLRVEVRHGLQLELSALLDVPRRDARVDAAEPAEVAAEIGHYWKG